MNLKITSFEVNRRKNPIGIDDKNPVFSFRTSAIRNASSIAFYELAISDADKNPVYNTGRKAYQGENLITLNDDILLSKTRYFVTLKLWDDMDEASEIACAFFETGFMDEPWLAKWVEPKQQEALAEKTLPLMDLLIPNPEFWGGEKRLRPVKELRKQLKVQGSVKSARAYVTAHGVYEMLLNGVKVGDELLAPGNAEYQKQLYYQTYDITESLVQGENALCFILGDGWWLGRLGLGGDSCNYGTKLSLIWQIEITYENGDKQVLASDGSEKCRDSHIEYSDLYIGEKQKLNERNDAWLHAGYDDSSWEDCRIGDGSCICQEGEERRIYHPKLTGQPINGIKVIEEIPVKRFITTPEGDFVMDFGTVLSGAVYLEFRAEDGQKVTLEHSEVLSKEGNYINNILGRNKDQKDVIICREGKQNFIPRFTFHGFRYVRVTGLSQSDISCAVARVMGTELQDLSSFTTDNDEINQLQRCILRSTVSNMCSVPTDCPQREKLGWTGDIQVFARTGCFNYDLYNFLSGWLSNVRLAQGADGEIPVVVPNPPKQELIQRMMSGGANSSAGWGDACVLVPYYLYECYGDVTVLSDNYDMMKGWMEYIKANAAEKPEGYSEFSRERKERNEYLWTKQFHFGDWLIPSLRALPDGVQRGTEATAKVVGSCFYAVTTECYIKVCEALGRKEEAKAHKERLQKIRAAICAEYVAEDGTVGNGHLQGNYVMILRSGAVTGELATKVADKLVELIKSNGYCMDAGFASVSYLLDMLCDYGHTDVAYRILMQTQAPSWLYMVRKGATSIWENWVAILPDGTTTDSSYNHYAFGCVGDFMYRHVAGIRALAPGYRRILFEPDLHGEINECSCSFDSSYGLIELSYTISDGMVNVRGRVPVGTTALLRIAENEEELLSGSFEKEFNL